MSPPLRCKPEDKERLEAENALKMLDYIAHLISCGLRNVRESHVLELQALAVGGIYRCAGSYRSALFDERENAEQVRIEGLRIGGSDHVPPGAASIRGYVIDMLDVCNAADREPLDRAAYALWRCNWIHPFAGGNGRVARALTYLILCMDMGAMIPGKTTMPRLIAAFRERYLAALQGVDKNTSELGGDAIDVDPALGFLQPMTRFVAAMLYLQLRSAKLTAP